MRDTCPFCQIEPTQHVARNALAYAIRDRYPVSAGHTLIIPHRHVATWFDATADEQAAMLALADEVKAALDAECRPDGYNLGLNVGEAAGQTVMHLHLHVIPRYHGDVDDPRGGVRYVVPSRGNYLRDDFQPAPFVGPQRLATGGRDHFIGHLADAFAEADAIDIVAAFVQRTGVDFLRERFESALARGARVRVLTGDYLAITQAGALAALLDLSRSEAGERRFEVRVVETDALAADGAGRTFHPKAWIFRRGERALAYVGSSNMSRAALTDGVEWNLRVDRASEPARVEAIRDAFDALWRRGRVIDDAWLDDYRLRVRDAKFDLPPGELDPDEPPEPRDVQAEALDAIRADRAEDRERGLVVLATGLGKTWLAAFDLRAFEAEHGRPARCLFIAHRFELLRQAALTYRRLFPLRRVGYFVGGAEDLDAELVFASVQRLARPEQIDRFAPDAFDYVVIDEVHHAHADSYRRVIAYFRPRWLLGLTATPERPDSGDIFGLFDDHTTYRADIGVGITLGHLVPFHYFGLADPTDYKPYWRSGKFAAEAIAGAVQTEERMQRVWHAWQKHDGTRTLVFCCTIAHAMYVNAWLSARGVRTKCVHSRPDSDDRQGALDALEAGVIDAVVTVDLFNEGIDCKPIDRVVMLRPTESSIVFLQQLGRGLRTADTGKTALTVLDFVGNHRGFLDRIRALINLGNPDREATVRRFLRDRSVELPEGCTVELELEAIDLLAQLLPSGADIAAAEAYFELSEARGVRPTLGEMHRRGHQPEALRRKHQSWFDFIAARDPERLSAMERRALDAAGAWLAEVEKTAMTKSYKMVVLDVLCEAGALWTGMALDELARRCQRRVLRTPALRADVDGLKVLPDPTDEAAFAAYWRGNPIRAWSRGRWFTVEDERLVPTLPLAADDPAADALAAMTTEVVGYRLARYLGEREARVGEPFEAVVRPTARGLRVELPDRARFDVPRGPTAVRLDDGAVWRVVFGAKAVERARPVVGGQDDALAGLLRRWFGPSAGWGGVDRVRFEPFGDHWRAGPAELMGEAVDDAASEMTLPYFETLRAAASWGVDRSVEDHAARRVAVERLPSKPEECFVVRVSGDSMDGGKAPLPDGARVVMRWMRGVGFAAVVGRVVLLARGDESGRGYHLKRVVETERGRALRSDNPAVGEVAIEAGDEVLGVLEGRC